MGHCLVLRGWLRQRCLLLLSRGPLLLLLAPSTTAGQFLPLPSASLAHHRCCCSHQATACRWLRVPKREPAPPPELQLYRLRTAHRFAPPSTIWRLFRPQRTA